MQQITIVRSEGQLFRERTGFLVLIIIGAYCFMRILIELQSILQPFLWALFLVMAFKPVVDGIERWLERVLALMFDRGSDATSPSSLSAEYGFSPRSAETAEELQSMIGAMDAEDIPELNEVSPAEPTRSGSRGERVDGTLRSSCQDIDGEEREAHRWRRIVARGLAVMVATLGMIGLISLFCFLILESARHMQDNWEVYQKGVLKLISFMRVLFNQVPASFKRQYQDISVDLVKTAQDFVYGVLGDVINNVESLLLGLFLTLLYTLFWLCSPVPMDSTIDVMFRKYIMFKTLACLGYGVCVGLLLASLSIDLASFFALTTFALNYVPEVGPFMAMTLPCPVIMLDSRLERPFLVLLMAVLGQLALKLAFGNIIEVKLIESDKKLRMHPVMILLSVGIFGHLWGPTGMLLSVPLLALLKMRLFSELVPSSYRDPILVILEGDRNAPQKHGLGASASNIAGRGRMRVGRRARSMAPPGG